MDPATDQGSDVAAEVDVIRKRSPRFFRWFARYARRFLRRGFHAVRILKATRPEDAGAGPLVIYCNHPSWNDPLVMLALAQELFPEREHYGPIDEVALERYGLFKRLGFFGVKPGSAAGLRNLLRTVDAIWLRNRPVLWITAQGRFADVRERPVRLQPGLGAILHHSGRETRVVPLAMEYSFGEERFPEIFLAFGTPVTLRTGTKSSARAWTERCEGALEETQDQLAAAVIAREENAFEDLYEGAAGVGGIYGWWQRGVALLTGRKYKPQHGARSTDER